MEYYDEDFYCEPSEFDIQIAEFKANLAKSVKEKFVSEMERLKNENKELQSVKSNFEEIKSDYKKKEYQLEIERKNLQSKVRRERLSDLMKNFQIIMYKARSKKGSLPKCNRCDDDRKINYTTPLGKKTYERCDCGAGKFVYHPQEYTCYEFKIDRDKDGISAWYKIDTSQNDEEYASFDDSTFTRNIYQINQMYEEISVYDTFFKTEEDCQGYCDYLNTNKNAAE